MRPGRLGIFLAVGLAIQLAAFALLAREISVKIPAMSQGLSPHERTEIVATLALFAGAALTLYVLVRTVQQTRQAEQRLERASLGLHDRMQQYFDNWKLTPAERENALLLVKGYSISDIARQREKSEATIKAQNTSIYRKSGMSGRAQFVSHLIEDAAGVAFGGGAPLPMRKEATHP